MPFANFKVPAGTLDTAQKEKIVHRATELYVELYGERARATTLVLVEEVPDGGWGIGDHVLTLAMLQQGAAGADSPDGDTPGTGSPGADSSDSDSPDSDSPDGDSPDGGS